MTQNRNAFARQGPGSRTCIEEELTLYLEKPERGVTPEIDVLDYWYDNRKMLPRLATLARYILCLPMTSGSTEKFVHTAGDIINPVRTLTDSAEAEKIVFCRKNYFQLRPVLSSGEMTTSDYVSGDNDDDASGSSLSDSDLGEKPGNPYK